MGQKPRVRPGLSSPDQSQDVEFTIDQQIDEGQHARDEREKGGALGPAKDDTLPRSDWKQFDVKTHQPSAMEKQHRNTKGMP